MTPHAKSHVIDSRSHLLCCSPPEKLLGGGLSTPVPPFCFFGPLSRTKPAFWINTRTAPGPISKVLPGCLVRHPQYYKKLFVRVCSVLQCVAVRDLSTEEDSRDSVTLCKTRGDDMPHYMSHYMLHYMSREASLHVSLSTCNEASLHVSTQKDMSNWRITHTCVSRHSSHDINVCDMTH